MGEQQAQKYSWWKLIYYILKRLSALMALFWRTINAQAQSWPYNSPELTSKRHFLVSINQFAQPS
jgi:hypothetical protein